MFDFSLVFQYGPFILQGLPTTLKLTLIAVFCSIIGGLIIALIKINKVPILRHICTLYVSFMRGVPLMVMLYMSYYGLPIVVNSLNESFGTSINVNSISPFTFALIAFILQESAYESEVIRAALLSVDRKEIEAAKSIGMTGFQTLYRITLPQAMIVAVPSFGNALTSLMKGTSLAFTIAVMDVMGKAKVLGGRNFHYFEAYFCAGIIYWICCIIIEVATKWVEKKINFYNREIPDDDKSALPAEGDMN